MSAKPSIRVLRLEHGGGGFQGATSDGRPASRARPLAIRAAAVTLGPAQLQQWPSSARASRRPGATPVSVAGCAPAPVHRPQVGGGCARLPPLLYRRYWGTATAARLSCREHGQKSSSANDRARCRRQLGVSDFRRAMLRCSADSLSRRTIARPAGRPVQGADALVYLRARGAQHAGTTGRVGPSLPPRP